MQQKPQKIIFLTAGAAGMFCGSCMHDNAIAKTLIAMGHDCVLQPFYTPIRTDDDSIARPTLFFGGIHIYLLDKMPWLTRLPRAFRRVLDFPPLVRWITARAHSTDAESLGHLTISMLRGIEGPQADEVRRLTQWLEREQPDIVLLSNLLIGGVLPEIKRCVPAARRMVLLQGDDIFLDHLKPRDRQAVAALMNEVAADADHLIVNSEFYARVMSKILDLPADRFDLIPLSIETKLYNTAGSDSRADADGYHIGYMARLAPEKGLHHLVQAFIRIANQHDDVHLHVAGYLSSNNQLYFDQLVAQIERAGLANRFTHHGSVTLQQKSDLLRFVDVLSVPTVYQDPKGLFVLESMASGTPVVQPNHGAVGEIIQRIGGGILYPAAEPQRLIDALLTLRSDAALRQRLADEGRVAVQKYHSIEIATRAILALPVR